MCQFKKNCNALHACQVESMEKSDAHRSVEHTCRECIHFEEETVFWGEDSMTAVGCNVSCHKQVHPELGFDETYIDAEDTEAIDRIVGVGHSCGHYAFRPWYDGRKPVKHCCYGANCRCDAFRRFYTSLGVPLGDRLLVPEVACLARVPS